MTPLLGYRRPDGSLGARNHVLVLPSVVCADNTAARIAAAGGIAVLHQHGCGQVGDDALHTERAFRGYALNPNVGACVVVSLGCETVQGRLLHDRLAAAGQRTAFAGIQLLGGTDAATEAGAHDLEELHALLAEQSREPGTTADLRLGIESTASTFGRARELFDGAVGKGFGAVLAVPAGYPGERDVEPVVYGSRAQAAAAVVEHAGEGAEQHVALAAAGAQVIVSLRAPRQAPVSCAIVPVVAVAGDDEIFRALGDDFDLGPNSSADEILKTVAAVFSGAETAAERRGARDFVLRRMARTM
jgi:altronate dehydratase large subunit